MRLVFSGSRGPDEDSLRDVVATLCERLCAHPRLRRPLDRVVGNRWLEFEHDLTHFIAALGARTGDHGGGLPALFAAFPELTPEHVADARDLFVESALAVLPLHAAASLSDMADRVCDLALRTLSPQPDDSRAKPLSIRIKEAEEALQIGAGLG